jgi:glycosyltransferase involved in cell wall biosynthesis
LSGGSLAASVRSGVRFLAQIARKKRQGIRLVWTVHDVHFPESRHVTTEHLLQTILSRIVDGMIVRSESSARHVGAVFHTRPERMSVIPHAHYAGWYPNTVSRSDARAQLGIPQGDTVFLFFGALREYKGLPQLFESFRQVRSKRVTLLVAGWPRPKNLAEWVHTQAARDDRVRVFPRFISPDETQLYFNAANAFVLPVRDESTAASGSVALAATFGRAIIAPDQAWIIDPLPREGAIVYDKHGHDALRSALEQALDADLAAMGDCNREHIMPWGWDRIALLTRRVYEGERVHAVPGERTLT